MINSSNSSINQNNYIVKFPANFKNNLFRWIIKNSRFLTRPAITTHFYMLWNISFKLLFLINNFFFRDKRAYINMRRKHTKLCVMNIIGSRTKISHFSARLFFSRALSQQKSCCELNLADTQDIIKNNKYKIELNFFLSLLFSG